jgi:DNA repair exonuclease SbcCD nuclease subunit
MHRWQYGSRLTEQGYNSRLWFLYKALLSVRDQAKERSVDAVFVTGDIFHTHDKVDVQTLFLTATALMQIAEVCPLYLLVGNHDMATADGSIHSLKAFDSFATVIDKPVKFEVAGCPVIAHPYTKDIDGLNAFLDTAEEGSTALLHQGVAGASLGSSWVPDEKFGTRKLSPNIITAWCGHYHKPQISSQIAIPGSIAQHTWADREEFHGAWWYDSNGPSSSLNIETPKFVSLGYNESFMEIDCTDPQKEYPDLVAGNFVRMFDVPENVDIKKLREIMFHCGCESVELVFGEEIGVQSAAEGTLKTGDFSIEPLLKEYAETAMPERRALIGKLLREFSSPRVKSVLMTVDLPW